jgi:non-specific protein-tyrosine kinase
VELREYLVIIRRWWWLLVLGAILGGGIGFIANQTKTLTYQAKTTLMIGDFIQNANPDSGAIATSQRLAQAYADMARREPILRATTETLALEIDWSLLQGRVSANPVPNTQLLEISIRDADAQRAKFVADEVTRQLILQSPTTTSLDPRHEAKRIFVENQLEELQARINIAQQRMQDLEATLALELTAEGVQKRQQEIDALQNKLTTWQDTYASLLSFTQEDTKKNVNSLTVVEPATQPANPINATIEQDVALAVAIGGSLAMALAFLLEYLDDTIKTADDVQRVLNLITVGTIPKMGQLRRKTGSKGQVVVSQKSFAPVAEAYRALRTNLQFSSLIMTNPSTTLLITSADTSEGKSTVAANLAVVMAQSGKRVILVDGDLRRPSLHKPFNITNDVGLTNWLVDENLGLDTALSKTVIDNLLLLPSGPLPPNAADLLSSVRIERLIIQLTEQADIVIVDSPPLLAVTDASILASHVAATLLVIDAGHTRREVCQRGKEILERIGVRPLGVILNRFDPKWRAGYKYGYYNYYSTGNSGILILTDIG